MATLTAPFAPTPNMTVLRRPGVTYLVVPGSVQLSWPVANLPNRTGPIPKK